MPHIFIIALRTVHWKENNRNC